MTFPLPATTASLCVIMINVFPETPFVARTNTEVDSRNLPGAFVYLTVGLTNPCRHDSVKTMKDAATKMYR